MQQEQKKQWDADTIGRVFGIISEILYSIALYRKIQTVKLQDNLFGLEYKQFWTAISNNAIQMAAINWCKIFGAEKNNKTYYARFVERGRFIEKMRDVSFDAFSDQMRNFRDRFAVHEDDIEKRLPIADLDIAIKVMEAFRDTVLFRLFIWCFHVNKTITIFVTHQRLGFARDLVDRDSTRDIL